MPLKKKTEESTSVWGTKLESGDFIIVPRVLVRIHRYKDGLSKRLMPRHLMLLLVLASRRFKSKPLRAYWQELADDLGVSRETVRKWAYELRDMKLLGITQVRGREKGDNRVGYRNEKNLFNLKPFISVLEDAKSERDRQRKLKKQEGTEGEQ